MSPRISISLLGPFQATLGEDFITSFESGKVRALLAYLIIESDRPHSRDALAGLLWPDQTDASALGNLRSALSNLRRAIGDRRADPTFLLVTRHSIQFNAASDYTLDVTALANALDACEQGAGDESFIEAPIASLQQAAELYRGSFLEGFHIAGAPAFDEWLTFRREEFEQQALDILRRLAGYRERRGEYREAELCARRQLAMDPWNEEAHRRLMRALARQGRRSAALTQYERCRRTLAEEVGVEPAPETESLYARIRVASETRPHNLPPLDQRSFVDRSDEMGLVRQVLADPQRRLLTLVGPGGIGKSRLALRIARSAVADYLGPFLHGVFFVPLLAAEKNGIDESDTSLVTAIAQSLELSLSGSPSPDQQVLDALREWECLLLIDNGECLGEPSHAYIADLLRQTDGVQFLVTSRERLGLADEWVLEMTGLPYPETSVSHPHHADQAKEAGPKAESYAAVHLFLERARQADAAFSLNASLLQEQTAVARISRLTHGMPLAIELAAGWVRSLSCQEIARGIEEDVDLLTTAAPDRPARHQSLRATFEYSWRMLPSAERSALVRLSVFCGSFALNAATQVANAGRGVLADLRDKSLLQRTDGENETRYGLHPLLRQFAIEKTDKKELEETRARHAEYYGYLLNEQHGQLKGPYSPEALRKVASEIENIRAGWDWAVEQGRVDLIGAYAPGLYQLYTMRGWHHEGRTTFGRAVALRNQEPGLFEPDSEHSLLFAGLLCRLAEFERMLGGFERAEALLEEGRTIGHLSEDPAKLAQVYEQLGQISYWRGEYARATELLEFSLQAARDAGHDRYTAHILMVRGAVARDLGEYPRAHECFSESASLYRSLEHPWGIAHALRLLATATDELENYVQAQSYRQESLALCQEINDHVGQALVLRDLGQAAGRESKYGLATDLCHQGLSLLQPGEDSRARALILESLGRLMLDQEQHDQARAHLRAGFETAASTQDIPLILRILVAVARLLVQVDPDRNAEACAELLSIVQGHPASTPPLQAEAASLLARLTLPHPPPPAQRLLREIKQIVYSVLDPSPTPPPSDPVAQSDARTRVQEAGTKTP